MEEASTVDQNEQQHKNSDSTHVEFFNAVRKGTVEQVRKLLSHLKSTNTAVTEINENGKQDVGDRTSYRQKLLKALAEKNIGAVCSLIAEGREEEIKTLETLNSICKTVAEHERLKEANLVSCMLGKLESQIRCNGPCGCCRGGRERKGENYQTKREREEEQQWINILSDPLYICLNWLWRNNPNGGSLTSSDQEGTKKEDSRKSEDVIEAALHDANLLEKIALYEHHYSRDDYTRRAEVYEKFATDVIEGSTWDQLLEIMDDKGTGCLLTNKPGDFNQSLSLLTTAADKERKRFVASPKCQRILDEIIYYQWPHWQDVGRVAKFGWSIVQLLMVAISCFVYIPLRLLRKSPCFDEGDGCWWNFREIYEHPFSKFINHSTWYMVFLVFVFLNSMQHSFATRLMGLEWIDYVIAFFVLGFLVQEYLEAKRQGCYVYMSKWWNIVDTIIILTFLVSYAMWMISWRRFGKWNPREQVFVIADVLYASATVVAFFHLTHIFQIDSVLGPLQLSLYKMLKDVGRFLFIYLLLYLSFATGVVKVYSFYVTSQIELQKQNMSSDPQDSHPYDNHPNSLLAMFWLLLGLVEEGDIAVKDPSFHLTSAFGRLFLMAYVICTVIVALNMLIAMMNNSFEKIMDNADVEWKFSRARMWLEWIDKGSTIPAPLNLIYYTLFGLFKFFGWCLRISVEKCPCFNQQNEERNSQGDRVKATHIQKRNETLKDLIVEYLKKHYLENNEEERADRYHDEAKDVADEATRLDKSPKNIQENISLLKEMVDRHAKELTELNKRLGSLAK